MSAALDYMLDCPDRDEIERDAYALEDLAYDLIYRWHMPRLSDFRPRRNGVLEYPGWKRNIRSPLDVVGAAIYAKGHEDVRIPSFRIVPNYCTRGRLYFFVAFGRHRLLLDAPSPASAWAVFLTGVFVPELRLPIVRYDGPQ